MNNGYDKYENMKQNNDGMYMWIWHNFTFGLQTEQEFGGAVALGIMKITLFLQIESIIRKLGMRHVV